MTEKLFEPWPAWVARRVGVSVRVVGGLVMLAFGGFLVSAGNFAATYKRTPPVWEAEAIALVVAGLAVALAGLVWAMLPSRFSLFLAVGVVAATLLSPWNAL